MKKAKLVATILAIVFALGMLAGCGSDSAQPGGSGGGGGSAPAGGGGGGGSTPAGGGGTAAPTTGRDTAAPADTGQTFVLRIGTGTGGRHHQIIWMEGFKEALEEATNGRIEVQLFPAGQLGTMAELVQGLVDGTVDGGVFPAGYFDIAVGAAGVIDLAYLFDDANQMWRILFENDTLYQELFETNGVIVGTWLHNFDRQLISTSPIRSLDDIRGKVLWSLPSRTIHEEIRLLGGVASGLDTSEVAPGVQNGTLDGSVQDISLYFTQRLDQAGATYILNKTTGALLSVFTMSQAWWDRLPTELRTTVIETAERIALEVHLPYVNQVGGTAWSTMLADGLEVHEMSAEFEAAYRAALAPQVDWYLNMEPSARPIYDEFQRLIAADR